MFKFNRYKSLLYILVIAVLSGGFLYSFWFLHNNFYLTISWSENTTDYTAGYIKKVQTGKLDQLVEILKQREKGETEKSGFKCLAQDCRSTTTRETIADLTCRPEYGAGSGADCMWGKGEIHQEPEGDPLKNFMVFELKPELKPQSLTMKWPSIMKCDAYEVFLSPDRENWVSLGYVPESACPHEDKTLLAEYDVSGINFEAAYLKIVKLHDNQGDDSTDTPSEIELKGLEEIRIGENQKINLCP